MNDDDAPVGITDPVAANGANPPSGPPTPGHTGTTFELPPAAAPSERAGAALVPRRGRRSLVPRPTAVARAIPGAALRVTSLGWRMTEWTVTTSARVTAMAVEAARAGESPAEILEDVLVEARRAAIRLLGAVETEIAAAPVSLDGMAGRLRSLGAPDTLEEQVDDLLEVSNDVRARDDIHPAYRRVITELAPDEARILRVLAREGPQAAVDVRTRRPFGVGSRLVSAGLTMLGRLAGCAHPEQLPAYLDNLGRLGLVTVSPEPLDDLRSYQVLEVQPEVTEAMRAAGRGTTVRRRVELTAFGRNFCETCGLRSAGESADPLE